MAQQPHTYLKASTNDENTTGDNKAMAFLRKKGRIGGAANMDFANAVGLDESPSGGSKSALHEDGFKVSVQVYMVYFNIHYFHLLYVDTYMYCAN